MDDHGLARRALAEALGTALLVVAVVGPGIKASRLSPDDVGLQLLEKLHNHGDGTGGSDPALRAGVGCRTGGLPSPSGAC
jgi:hypothetical protein